ncbi:MAG TPA: CocE/NonD family hydrolase, partial [Pyrinomonadaceae bacterium]|nr:CocE/NonD family hydrolase [Pyrinomonadaceae bacterium]
MTRVLRLIVVWAIVLVPTVVVHAQESDPVFDATEAMIPMRDGVKLYTQVYSPRVRNEPLPFLLLRTPYGTGRLDSARLASSQTELTAEGFIIVVQDIRGRFKSEGQFVMLRQPRESKDAKAIDESTDAYDTIEWLVKNLPETNGKVGTIGSSYLGFLTLASEINPHPALKAAVPQSPMVDGWMGDDWFHNGAFRTGSLDFGVSQSTGKAEGSGLALGTGDDYTRYLEAGSMGDYARRLGIDHYPFVQKLFQNPAYTEF